MKVEKVLFWNKCWVFVLPCPPSHVREVCCTHCISMKSRQKTRKKGCSLSKSPSMTSRILIWKYQYLKWYDFVNKVKKTWKPHNIDLDLNYLIYIYIFKCFFWKVAMPHSAYLMFHFHAIKWSITSSFLWRWGLSPIIKSMAQSWAVCLND